jgi:hypothetical protein
MSGIAALQVANVAERFVAKMSSHSSSEEGLVEVVPDVVHEHRETAETLVRLRDQ